MAGNRNLQEAASRALSLAGLSAPGLGLDRGLRENMAQVWGTGSLGSSPRAWKKGSPPQMYVHHYLDSSTRSCPQLGDLGEKSVNLGVSSLAVPW